MTLVADAISLHIFSPFVAFILVASIDELKHDCIDRSIGSAHLLAAYFRSLECDRNAPRSRRCRLLGPALAPLRRRTRAVHAQIERGIPRRARRTHVSIRHRKLHKRWKVKKITSPMQSTIAGFNIITIIIIAVPMSIIRFTPRANAQRHCER